MASSNVGFQEVVEWAAHLSPEERSRLEVADFGLGELARTGLQLLTYLNTERCCAKELVLGRRQTCPEHWHPAAGGFRL